MLRKRLGQFCSIVCFKAAYVGMEEALGEKSWTIALIAADCTREKNLGKELGLTGNSGDWNLIFTLGAVCSHLRKNYQLIPNPYL